MAGRVLILTWEYPPIVEGGLARHVRKLAEGLVLAGTEVHVVTRGGGRLGAVEDRDGVTVQRVREPDYPRADLGGFIRWVHRMNEDMRATAADLLDMLAFEVVHSHDWLVAGAAERLARAAGLPWLVTVHATEHGRHQGWVGRWPQSHIHRAERMMVRRADRVITCSHYMRTHVADVFAMDEARITAIPNGIDPRDLQPLGDLPRLRRRFAAPDEKLVLLVGRLHYEKGFHLALDALADVIRRVDGVRFVVAGSGTAEADLKAQARRLRLNGHGTFLGWIGDDILHSLYRIADLCVVPSIYEPFGLVALEAMASGCPCLVADTGGLREVVPRGQRVGLRFRAQDSRALARTLRRALADDALRARLVAEAAEHVRAFDWDDVARRTAAVYDELARARQPGPGVARGAGAGPATGSYEQPARARADRPADVTTALGGTAPRTTA